MSYRKLEIWQLARELVIDIHGMTLVQLPRFEMFEEESQIRSAVAMQVTGQARGGGLIQR